LDNSITSITIAHRLSTVIESDRILVLSHGQLKEYDHPHLLLQNPTGFLSKMVRQTGAESEQDLRNRAEQVGNHLVIKIKIHSVVKNFNDFFKY